MRPESVVKKQLSIREDNLQKRNNRYTTMILYSYHEALHYKGYHYDFSIF